MYSSQAGVWGVISNTVVEQRIAVNISLHDTWTCFSIEKKCICIAVIRSVKIKDSETVHC